VLDQAVATTAILAPQQGITRDPKGNATAMVVGADNKVEVRTLVADRAIGDRWLVTGGLVAGDKLIVEGLNKIGPGMPVHATEVKPAAPPPGAAAPPAGDKPADDKPADGKPADGKPTAPTAAPTAPTAPTTAPAGSNTQTGATPGKPAAAPGKPAAAPAAER
jgi:septal ring-binding cell division protein DamX